MNVEASMQVPTIVNASTNGEPSAPALRLFRPNSPVVALGLAVDHLMTKTAFARLRFGNWSRILVGQINRGHYYFVIDGDNQTQGFFGWGLTTREKAEAWVEGRRGLSYEDSKEGECLVFNMWTANSLKVHRFMVDEARQFFKDKQTLYFKRYYNDGRTRPVRLNVNDFVVNHIDRRMSAPDAPRRGMT
jgi:hemolysin-activating ACP:hemolysin acyltransferase